MNTDWNPNEEYNILPEYTETYEYTPEYPDVTFFKESSVTAREENISQGEAPAGEDSFTQRREKRRKKVREYWLRNLLGAAVRGGVILMATAGLVVTLATGHEQEPTSPAGRISEQVAELKKPALSQPHDYGPRQLASLWRGEPQAPHQYDMDHPVTVRDGSCTEDGLIEYYCTECHAALKYSIRGGHRAQAAERENEKAPTCTENGSYDSVVYCAVCHEELSRTTTVLPATGHTPEEAASENEKAATCTENGSYDSVVYCSVCHEEISREAITLESPGHIEDHPVQENLVKASCTEEGSYDKVIYCSVCHEELSREAVTLPLAKHDPGVPEEGESKEPTCTEDGFYEEITVCRNCGKELLRETITLAATGHTAGAPKEEILTELTCTEDGHYDTVTYCTVCGEEILRESIIEEAPGHSYTETVTAATCTAQGYTTHTCERCGESYRDSYTEALGHTYGAWTVTKAATCTATGTEEHRCSRCGNTETRSIATVAHTAGNPVERENYVAATCTASGGYDTNVVHCTFCNQVLSKEHVTLSALGHSFAFEDLHWENEDPEVCERCGEPALKISIVNGNSFSYSINQDFYNQALDMGMGHLSWGDAGAYAGYIWDEDYEEYLYVDTLGFAKSGYNLATSPSGTVVLDFEPTPGQTVYFRIRLRVTTSTNSDFVYFIYPIGGEHYEYTP